MLSPIRRLVKPVGVWCSALFPSNVWTRCPNKDYLSHDGECNPVASDTNTSPEHLATLISGTRNKRQNNFVQHAPTPSPLPFDTRPHLQKSSTALYPPLCHSIIYQFIQNENTTKSYNLIPSTLILRQPSPEHPIRNHPKYTRNHTFRPNRCPHIRIHQKERRRNIRHKCKRKHRH